jgi:adenosylmethionine-8-amino-7-oxononanoate aminotransferase
MHAWEQEDIYGPDIQTVGKALGGGFVPLSGVLLNQRIFDALAAGSRSLAHGHTFQGCRGSGSSLKSHVADDSDPKAHPIACAGAIAVQYA